MGGEGVLHVMVAGIPPAGAFNGIAIFASTYMYTINIVKYVSYGYMLSGFKQTLKNAHFYLTIQA